jgi:tetratricopeptide (TPR) repeat protein
MTSSALIQLAALLKAGRYGEVEAGARRLLNTEANSAVLWRIFAASLTAQDKDAFQALTAAVRLQPNDAETHNNLGNAYARQGRLDRAVSSYRRAVHLNWRLVEAHNNLARALLDLRHFDDAAASCRRAIDLRPWFAEAHDNYGSVLIALGRLEDAEASFQRAIAIEPEFAEAHNNLGNVLLQRGRLQEAAASYRRALDANPNLAEAHSNLGSALRGLGQLEEALGHYDRALLINPRFLDAHCNRATVLRLQRRTEQARKSGRRALDINPRCTAALMILAEACADGGRFADAEALFNEAISIEPDSPEAWAGLARVRRMTAADAHWLAQAQRIANGAHSPPKEITLRYSIGKYFDDLGEFDRAFPEFRRANELTKLCRPQHDREQLTQTVDFITRTFDKMTIATLQTGATQSARPVFLVGMLRSGTTLVEQILASHPAVFGAGELPFWSSAFARYRTSYGEHARGNAELARFAVEYLRELRALSSDATFVVDKMPTNFAFLGLIHAALPKARIIHVRRHPLDTCLSVYFQHLESLVSYANDLEDLAHYYAEYLRIMGHWRATLPENVMLEVAYEDLVANQESCTRTMLEFLGLPWDSRCLEFHRVDRTVITASKWQVRQKISDASVGRWRNYVKFLGPLLPLITD